MSHYEECMGANEPVYGHTANFWSAAQPLAPGGHLQTAILP